LQSKYPKLKPEIKVNLYIEDDKEQGQNNENLETNNQQFKPTRDPKIGTYLII
jgi:hypothetical protein